MAAADGTFNSPTENVIATINVSATGWAAGTSHTLTVRVKDAAGTWSATGSVVVVVTTLPNAILCDGFESGSFSAWTSSTGAGISVTAAAARLPSAFGMQAIVSGNTPGYVTDATPVQDAQYHARFYFNPNNMVTTGGQATIFTGVNTAGTPIFQVQYRRIGNGNSQVRLSVLRPGVPANTNYYTISRASFTPIEIAWASGTSATARLYTGGVLRQTLTNLNTNASKLDCRATGPVSWPARRLERDAVL